MIFNSNILYSIMLAKTSLFWLFPDNNKIGMLYIYDYMAHITSFSTGWDNFSLLLNCHGLSLNPIKRSRGHELRSWVLTSGKDETGLTFKFVQLLANLTFKYGQLLAEENFTIFSSWNDVGMTEMMLEWGAFLNKDKLPWLSGLGSFWRRRRRIGKQGNYLRLSAQFQTFVCQFGFLFLF